MGSAILVLLFFFLLLSLLGGDKDVLTAFSAMVGGVFGMAIGIIPAIVGAARGKVWIGLLGLFGCVWSGAVIGFPWTFFVCGGLICLAAIRIPSHAPAVPNRLPKGRTESAESELARLKERIADLEEAQRKDGESHAEEEPR